MNCGDPKITHWSFLSSERKELSTQISMAYKIIPQSWHRNKVFPQHINLKETQDNLTSILGNTKGISRQKEGGISTRELKGNCISEKGVKQKGK